MSGSFQNLKDIQEREVFVKEPTKTPELMSEDWDKSQEKNKRRFPLQTWQLVFLLILLAVIATVIAVIVLVFFSNGKFGGGKIAVPVPEKEILYSCSKTCNITVVESIPENVTYPNGSVRHMSVFDGWVSLLHKANKTLDIASSYWTLRGEDTNTTHPSTKNGEIIFNLLVDAAKRGIQIRIVHQVPMDFKHPFPDLKVLSEYQNVEVRELDMKPLVGGGIIHTKMWLVDGMNYYVGSANMDWRSLTQVKEIGLVTYNCECMAQDMQKIFDVYWMMAKPDANIPDHWPEYLSTDINKDTPLEITFNGTEAQVYLASSPPEFCPTGRTVDVDSVLDVISKARKRIDIEVMDYFPTSIYTSKIKYWPVIDNALRTAAVDHGVDVRLLVGLWKKTNPNMVHYLRSLQDLDGVYDDYEKLNVSIQVRFFHIAETDIAPFTRVNHDKFMVTDNAVYVGTSNWSEDYFVNTCGIGYVINQTSSLTGTTVQEQVSQIFERDWNSVYAKELPPRS